MAEMSLSEYNERQKVRPTHQGFTLPPQTGFIIGGILLLAIGFGGGLAYQKGKHATVTTTAAVTGQNGTSGQSRFGGGLQRGNRAIGTISNISSTSISITTRQGTTATYAITSSTTVTNSGQSASVSDIQTGDTVFITLDGSNTQDAASIMLNPSFGGGSTAPTSSTNSSGASSSAVST